MNAGCARMRASEVLFLVAMLPAAISDAVAAAEKICDDFDVQVATTPIPPQFANSLRRHAMLMETIPRGPADVVVIGDSLVEQWPQTLLNEAFARKTVVNLGVGGDRTQNVLWRLGTGHFDSLKPRTVALLVGINNFFARQSTCAVSAGIIRILNDVRQRWNPKRIVDIEMPTYGKDFSSVAGPRAQISAAVRERFRNDPDITFVNVDRAISCNGGEPCENFQSDKVHLTAPGYHVLSDAVRMVIE
jgi:lysophospholipase L1-like esterase